MKRRNILTSAWVTILFLAAGFAVGAAQAASIAVDAAIRGNANGIFIDTGNSWSESGPPLAVPVVSIGDTVSANGYTFQYLASSNMQAGALKVLTSAVSDAASSGSASSSIMGMPQAFAHLEEDLTFTPSGSDPYQVTLSMAIDGTFLLDPSSSYSNLAGLIMSEYGGAYLTNFIALAPGDPVSQLIQLTMDLQGVSAVYVFAALESYIYSIGGGGRQTSADFSNTAALSLTVPAGVSVSSSSGMFLTAVPVPGAAWLLGSGLIALCGWRRRAVAFPPEAPLSR